jgi:hypothetical protein
MATLSGIITPTNVLTASSTATLTNKTWNSNTIGVAYGGTGQTTYTNGELLIGNTTGNTLTKATLTAGSGITVTNGGGSITIAALVSAAANSGSRIFLANSFGGF